jgi:hypothetical protein
MLVYSVLVAFAAFDNLYLLNRKSSFKMKKLIFLLVIPFLVSCGDDDTMAQFDVYEGFQPVSSISSEGAGSNCQNGGFKVDIGIDVNLNRVLDADEFFESCYVCNGTGNTISESDVIVNAVVENDCSNEGLRVRVGVDLDADSFLSEDEFVFISKMCNDGSGRPLAVDNSNGREEVHISGYLTNTDVVNRISQEVGSSTESVYFTSLLESNLIELEGFDDVDTIVVRNNPSLVDVIISSPLIESLSIWNNDNLLEIRSTGSATTLNNVSIVGNTSLVELNLSSVNNVSQFFMRDFPVLSTIDFSTFGSDVRDINIGGELTVDLVDSLLFDAINVDPLPTEARFRFSNSSREGNLLAPPSDLGVSFKELLEANNNIVITD